MKHIFLDLQVDMPTYEADALLNWLAENNYLLYYKEFK